MSLRRMKLCGKAVNKRKKEKRQENDLEGSP
jgi:hypothetical protein